MNPKVARAVSLAKTTAGMKAAREHATAALPEFPKNGCAAFLSSLLTLAGIDVGPILSAGTLASTLSGRGWECVKVGEQQTGDVAVTKDLNENGIPDHIFLVVGRLDADAMLIADNQSPQVHERYASGHGKTAVAYFLRAPA